MRSRPGSIDPNGNFECQDSREYFYITLASDGVVAVSTREHLPLLAVLAAVEAEAAVEAAVEAKGVVDQWILSCLYSCIHGKESCYRAKAQY